MNRRTFLQVTAGAGAGMLSGCASFSKGTMGTPMEAFAAQPMARVRIGVIGLGSRGLAAVKRLSLIEGADLVAVCDKLPPRAEAAKDALVKAGKPAPRVYTGGEEAWKALADSSGIDLVYIVTPWLLHTPMAVYAMRAGKHAVTEVPSAMTIDECWNLVETSEKTRRHFMMLENCCYGETEMLFLNLCRQGLLGEVFYAEAGYLHDLRQSEFSNHGEEGLFWRLRYNMAHDGNPYPTHGLGPLCQCLNINRGDAFATLSSQSSGPFALRAYAVEKFGKDSPQAKLAIRLGDMNVSLIRTHNDRLIVLNHDVTSAHPYSRIERIQGTKGIVGDYPLRAAFAPATENWMDAASLQKLRAQYRHPLWKKAGEDAKKQGGHGGMDYVMDCRLIDCLRNGLPLDMSVYDAAAWCSVVELSERSVEHRGGAVDVPDFTRGAWRNRRPLAVDTING